MKTLRGRILTYFAALIVFLILFLVLTINFQVKKTAIPSVKYLSKQIIEAKANQIGEWIYQRVCELKILSENTLIISRDKEEVKAYLKNVAKNHSDYFESLGIVDLEGNKWVTTDDNFEIASRDYFKEIARSDKSYIVSNPIISKGNKEPIIVILHEIKDKNGIRVGYISGAVPITKLSEIAASIKMHDGVGWIIDNNGLVFAHANENLRLILNVLDSEKAGYKGLNEIGRNMIRGYSGIDNIVTPDGKRCILIYSPIPYVTSWSLGITFPEYQLTKDTNQLLQMVLLLGILALIIGVILSAVLSASVVKPLRNLKGLMSKAEQGNLDIYYEVKSNDEIEQLGNSFNRMIKKIKDLLKMVQIEQIKKREAELKVLQAQIQPHFLYNTLDTIRWMAIEHDAFDIAKVVRALTQLFRISISNGNEVITVGEEIEHVKSYLYIQKVRYEDKLNYKVCCDENIKECKVLKLILQPLVENAIYHGIKNRQGNGEVLIKGTMEDGIIVFTVSDNGVGIEHDKLEKIRKVLNGQKALKQDTGYGLYNVNERIRMMFGNSYKISIDSEYDAGTQVKVFHPPIK